MNEIYVRHNISSTKEILKNLWEERLIALHYQDIESLDPKDYESPGRKGLTRLFRFCKTGAICGANYRELYPSKLLIGRLPAGSQIELRKFFHKTRNLNLVYKVVKLEETKEIEISDYPLLAGVQPQRSAICKWPSANGCLKALIEGSPLPLAVTSLHFSQLEVICYEYLRKTEDIKALLAPIGRSMIDVDILGISDKSKRTLAQVTFSKNTETIKSKKSKLDKYKNENCKLYFFGPESKYFTDETIKYIKIEAMFEELISEKDSIHFTMICRMLGYL